MARTLTKTKDPKHPLPHSDAKSHLYTSRRRTLARAVRFFARDLESFRERESLRWARFPPVWSTSRGWMCCSVDSVSLLANPLSIPTGLVGSLSSRGRSGCFTTACTSTRRGVRTTLSSTTLPPAPRAAPRRSSLLESRSRGMPFTRSLHHLAELSASGAVSMDGETSGISTDFHLCLGLKRGYSALPSAARW